MRSITAYLYLEIDGLIGEIVEIVRPLRETPSWAASPETF